MASVRINRGIGSNATCCSSFKTTVWKLQTDVLKLNKLEIQHWWADHRWLSFTPGWWPGWMKGCDFMNIKIVLIALVLLSALALSGCLGYYATYGYYDYPYYYDYYGYPSGHFYFHHDHDNFHHGDAFHANHHEGREHRWSLLHHSETCWKEVASIVFTLRLLWKVTITGELRIIVLGLGGYRIGGQVL